MVILDRPRHADLIAEVRASGCRIRLITDGDVYGSVATCWPDAGVDVLFGIGGTPEGVISAAAMKAMGGEIQARLVPAERRRARRRRWPPATTSTAVLTQDDLVHSDNCFFAATGLTDGALLRGVRFGRDGARTQSLVMRSRSGTVRMIDATHRVEQTPRVRRHRLLTATRPRDSVIDVRTWADCHAFAVQAMTTGQARPAMPDRRRAMNRGVIDAAPTSALVERAGHRRASGSWRRRRARSRRPTRPMSTRSRDTSTNSSACCCALELGLRQPRAQRGDVHAAALRTSSCSASVRLVTYAFVAAYTASPAPAWKLGHARHVEQVAPPARHHHRQRGMAAAW